MDIVGTQYKTHHCREDLDYLITFKPLDKHLQIITITYIYRNIKIYNERRKRGNKIDKCKMRCKESQKHKADIRGGLPSSVVKVSLAS